MRKTIWLSVRPETEVLFREAKQALERERGEKLDEDALLEAMCRALLARGRAANEALCARIVVARSQLALGIRTL